MEEIRGRVDLHPDISSTRLVQPDPLHRSSDEVESVLLKIDTGNLSWKSDPTNQTDILLMIESIFRLSAITQNGQGAWQVRLALCSDNGKEVGDSLALGFVLEEMGQHECAENFYQRLLPQLPKDHEDIPRCYHALDEVCQKQGQHENGIKWLKKTLEIDTANGKENAPYAAMSHHSLGIVHIRKGEYSAALKLLKKAMEIWKKSFGDDHLDLAMCYNNMGIAYQEQRKYTEALDSCRKAWPIRQKQLPIDDRLLAQSHACVGNALYYLNHYDTALDHFRFAFKI